MAVDPDIQNLLTMLEAMDAPPLSEATPEEAREAFRHLAVDYRRPEALVQVDSTEDLTVDGAVGQLPARIYRPRPPGTPSGTLVFFHGGGWVIGDIESHDDQARMICSLAGVVVVSVAYRLAPEAKFPAAYEDCLAATRWAGRNVGRLGGDPSLLAVGGDSAGGNLAAGVAQGCRDAGGPRLGAQFLVYPAVDATGTYESRSANAEGYFLTRADMEWFSGHYARTAEDLSDPRFSPMRGNLEGLPPAIVGVAEYDPLHDEGAAYASALSAVGVPVVLREGTGLIHGFFGFGALSAAAKAVAEQLCRDLGGLLTG